MKKRISCMLLSILLLCLCACGEKSVWRAAYERTGQALQSEVNELRVGSVGGEWCIIGLSRSGRLTSDAAHAYLEQADAYIRAIGTPRLHQAKSTENSRLILGITAAGGDVTNIGGVNLLAGLTDMKYLSAQGLNGAIWALIALDCGGYEIPAAQPGETQTTREGLVDLLLSSRNADGGWSLFGESSDPDMTAMALQALAPYRQREDVARAAESAVDYLSVIQLPSGGFSSWGTANCESCAQVIVALTALELDPQKEQRLIKNDQSVVDVLCTFAVNDGFYHSADLAEVNGMATEQAYYALTAYARFLDGQTRLYDMTDCIT